MGVAVIVPWRPGCPHREAAWGWVRQQWATAHPDWELIEGRAPDGPWCKAAAVADGIARTDADSFVIADADVWCDRIDLSALTETWVVPHGEVHRLDEPSTRAVIDGGPLQGSYARRPYRGHAGGGIVALTRQQWATAPLDPRFQNWGQEDDSWALALRRLVGAPRRGSAPLWHLWHPPAPRLDSVIGSRESWRLARRYQAARTQDQMADLIREFT